MQFIPRAEEDTLIAQISKRVRTEFALIRITPTMLEKSIIDASTPFRTLIKLSAGLDYYRDLSPGGTKVYIPTKILTHTTIETKTSLYRPATKKGDPRFCVYGLGKYLRPDEMIYITYYNDDIVIIPLVQSLFSSKTIEEFFPAEDSTVFAELLATLQIIKSKGPILSVSPDKNNPKDVGDTFEQQFNMLPNSRKTADYKEKIELKTKRAGLTTKDTLFSMVPNWDISPINSSNKMIMNFGYPSTRHEGFQDLFVTVSSTPNNQGLFLEVDDDNELIIQKHRKPDGAATDTCYWRFEDVKHRLFEKHPETVWVVAKQMQLDGQYHFFYNKVEHTRRPIFSSFLLLISKGIVTFDWRGRVRFDGSGYKDKGHCFRILPRDRAQLFGEIETVEL